MSAGVGDGWNFLGDIGESWKIPTNLQGSLESLKKSVENVGNDISNYWKILQKSKGSWRIPEGKLNEFKRIRYRKSRNIKDVKHCPLIVKHLQASERMLNKPRDPSRIPERASARLNSFKWVSGRFKYEIENWVLSYFTVNLRYKMRPDLVSNQIDYIIKYIIYRYRCRCRYIDIDL